MRDLRALAVAAGRFARRPEGWVGPVDVDAFPVLADAVMEMGWDLDKLAAAIGPFIDEARLRIPQVLFMRGSETEERRGRPMTDAEILRALLDGTLRKRVRSPRRGRTLILGIAEYEALGALERAFASLVAETTHTT